MCNKANIMAQKLKLVVSQFHSDSHSACVRFRSQCFANGIKLRQAELENFWFNNSTLHSLCNIQFFPLSHWPMRPWCIIFRVGKRVLSANGNDTKKWNAFFQQKIMLNYLFPLWLYCSFGASSLLLVLTITQEQLSVSWHHTKCIFSFS